MTDVLAAGTVEETAADTGAGEVETTDALAATGAAETTTGNETTAAATPDFPEDWRAKIAGEDKSLLKTLERIGDPAALGKKLAELNKLAGQKSAAPKKPGKDASAEEIAAYRQAVGLHEKAELYLENVKLPDGRVLGDEDKAIAANFAERVLGADYSQEQFDTAMAWYLDHVEEAHAQQAEADDTFRSESLKELKTEWGADYTRNVRVISTLFADAPEGLSDRLFGARDAEGVKLGNDPAFVRWASKLALELNPTATVLPRGEDHVKTVENEIADLQKMMADFDSDYHVGPKSAGLKARYRELIDAREKLAKR
jgi:hypothetical protein